MIKNKSLVVLSVVIVAFLVLVTLGKSNILGADLLWQWSNGGSWLLPLVVFAAIVDSINPCAFSILLLTIAFLFGLGKPRGQVLRIGLLYIFGVFAAYILIGLGLLQALHLFNTPHFMAKVGAWLVIVLGLLGLTSYIWPRFPVKLRIPKISHAKIAALMHKATMPTAVLLGVLVGLCEFPCTGGPYLAILALLHDSASKVLGLGYLLLYNLLFVLPLVIVLLLAADQAVLERLQIWRKSNNKKLKLFGLLAMLLLGALLLLL